MADVTNTELYRLARQYLEAWLSAEDLPVVTMETVHRLEFGLKKTLVPTADGHLRFVLSRDQLMVELPNDPRHTRRLGGR